MWTVEFGTYTTEYALDVNHTLSDILIDIDIDPMRISEDHVQDSRLVRIECGLDPYLINNFMRTPRGKWADPVCRIRHDGQAVWTGKISMEETEYDVKTQRITLRGYDFIGMLRDHFESADDIILSEDQSPFVIREYMEQQLEFFGVLTAGHSVPYSLDYVPVIGLGYQSETPIFDWTDVDVGDDWGDPFRAFFTQHGFYLRPNGQAYYVKVDYRYYQPAGGPYGFLLRYKVYGLNSNSYWLSAEGNTTLLYVTMGSGGVSDEWYQPDLGNFHWWEWQPWQAFASSWLSITSTVQVQYYGTVITYWISGSNVTMTGEALLTELSVQTSGRLSHLRALEAILLLNDLTIYTLPDGTLTVTNRLPFLTGTVIDIDDADVIEMTQMRLPVQTPRGSALDILDDPAPYVERIEAYFDAYQSARQVELQVLKRAAVLTINDTIRIYQNDLRIVELSESDELYHIVAWEIL